MNMPCFYNAVFTKFNECVEYNKNFYVNMSYPSFYMIKNCKCSINKQILDSINENIKNEMQKFKEDIQKEEIEENKVNIEQNQKLVKYKLISDFNTTFNKNHILSSNINLMVFTNKEDGIFYNEIYNYNIDLNTGNPISIKDVFMNNVDYLRVINNYVKYKISQNKENFYEDAFIDVSENVAFYLTDEALVVYFDADAIAPKEFGNPKFKMEYKKFLPYINPKFYCTPQNLE